MTWLRLTEYDERNPIWVNMRTHDYMTLAEWSEGKGTRLHVHDGGHVDVVETPEEILALLGK